MPSRPYRRDIADTDGTVDKSIKHPVGGAEQLVRHQSSLLDVGDGSELRKPHAVLEMPA